MNLNRTSRERLLKIALKHLSVTADGVSYPLFHISFRKDLAGMWTPRAPDTDDAATPVDPIIAEPMFSRISTSDTVPNCFRAIYANVKHYFEEEDYPHMDMYVYTPVFKGKERILLPQTLTDYKIIHDAHVTNEHCILTEVQFKLHSQIRVTNTKNVKRVKYDLFNDKSLGDGWLPGDIEIKTLKTY